MKFAHIADCHVGGWREPKLRDVNERSFISAIDLCVSRKVDFVLICGDLFNSAFPAIDSLRIVVEKLKELKDNCIPVYIIAGSHDSSASGKTIIDVLESAGLAINVAQGSADGDILKLKFTVDSKTGVKLVGMVGKRAGLEKELYRRLSNDHLENDSGLKIFLFHSAIEELKQEGYSQMDAVSASFFPKNFFYYAGGHVHVIDRADVDGRNNIVFPGPIFPNNFSEVEKLGCGSFCIVDDGKIERVKLAIHPVVCVKIDCAGKNASDISRLMGEQFNGINVKNAIICLRVEGRINSGRICDIDFKGIFSLLDERGAYFVMKNSNGLSSPEFENVKINADYGVDIEDKIIGEHLTELKLVNKNFDVNSVKVLLKELCAEKNESEKVVDFEKRVIGAVDGLMFADLFRAFFSK